MSRSGFRWRGEPVSTKIGLNYWPKPIMSVGVTYEGIGSTRK
jgi:hypothetical protein